MNNDRNFAMQKAVSGLERQLRGFGSNGISDMLMGLAMQKDGFVGSRDVRPLMKAIEQGPIAQANALSAQLRGHDIRKGRLHKFPGWSQGLTEDRARAISKATLDVGSLTNLADFSGGQALGFVSWDTKLARGTVRPKSFTLYNYLKKTVAGNIVDYWTYASSTGGQIPGAAYSSFGNQTTGTIAINAGSYDNKFINLKLAVDGRAITMALAQQNSITNIADQESANAALNILSTINWTAYWGNPDLYPNQQGGIAYYIPPQNIFDFNALYNSTEGQATGDSPQQYLFDLIYEVTGKINSYGSNGQVTHAFMAPSTIADLQSLVTTQLRNVANTISRTQFESRSIVVSGELVGMNTNFGDIAFPIDMFINARNIPAQAMVKEVDETVNMAQPSSVLAAPASVSVAAATAITGGFTGEYAGKSYVYAVATVDADMNESLLAYSDPVEIANGQTATVTVTAGTVGTPAAFRVYRSGAGYDISDVTKQNPASFRHIGDIPATGTTFALIDSNATIPGSDTLFLLDLDDEDDALDYRTMLPLSKIELFAQNLYMPWALAHIGALRPRVPKWHAIIRNYPSANPTFQPLAANFEAEPVFAG